MELYWWGEVEGRRREDRRWWRANSCGVQTNWSGM
jgi:hypothetical protein